MDCGVKIFAAARGRIPKRCPVHRIAWRRARNREADTIYRIDLEGSPTGAGTLEDPYLYGIHDADGYLIAGRVARGPVRKGVCIGAFACRYRNPGCLLTGFRRLWTKGADAHQQEEIAPERVGQQHVRIDFESSLQKLPGIAPEDEEIVHGRVQGGGILARRSQFQTALVLSQSQPPGNPYQPAVRGQVCRRSIRLQRSVERI